MCSDALLHHTRQTNTEPEKRPDLVSTDVFKIRGRHEQHLKGSERNVTRGNDASWRLNESLHTSSLQAAVVRCHLL